MLIHLPLCHAMEALGVRLHAQFDVHLRHAAGEGIRLERCLTESNKKDTPLTWKDFVVRDVIVHMCQLCLHHPCCDTSDSDSNRNHVAISRVWFSVRTI